MLRMFDWRLMLPGFLLNCVVVFLINLREGTLTEAGGSGLLQFLIAFTIGGYLPTFVKRMAILQSGFWAYVCGGPLAAAGVAGLVGALHYNYDSPGPIGTTVWSFCLVLMASSFLVWYKRNGDTVPTRLRPLAKWL